MGVRTRAPCGWLLALRWRKCSFRARAEDAACSHAAALLVAQHPSSAAAQRSLAFSADGKILVGLGNAPDYVLLWWQWDKSKVLGYAKVGQPAFKLAQSRPADTRDPSTCAVAGPKLLRFFKIGDAKGEGVVKAANAAVGKRELLDFTDLCWLGDERLLACAATGEVCVFEAQELRQVLQAVHPNSAPLRAIIPCARGFIVAGDRGLLSVHERTEDNAFVPLKMFTCQGALARIGSSAPVGAEPRQPDAITSICLSPSEDVLVCTSGNCQVSSAVCLPPQRLRAACLCSPAAHPFGTLC